MKKHIFYIFLLIISQLSFAQQGIVLYNQSLVLVQKQQYNSDANKINKAILEYNDSYILQTAIDINIYAKRFEQAKNIANQLIEPEKFLAFAKIYVGKELYDSAYFYMQKYLKSSNKKPEFILKNDSILVKMSSSKQWRLLWSKKWYDSLYIKLDKLESQVKYGDAANAIIELMSLKNLYTTNWRIYYLLSEGYQRIGANKQAINQLIKALEYKKDDFNLIKKLSFLYAQNNEYGKAANFLEKAYKLRPYQIDLLPQIAKFYLKSSQTDKTIKFLTIYLKYNDSDKQVKYKLAEVYYIEGKYLEAIRTINQLMSEKQIQDNYKYFTLRGKAYFHTNSYKNSYYDLTMSLDLNPNQPELYRIIGQSAYLIGHKQEACLYWQRSYETFHDQNSKKMRDKLCKKLKL